MSLRDCIGRAVAGGEMDPGSAREATELFDELVEDYGRRFSDTEARRRAGADTVSALRRDRAERRRRELLQRQRAQALYMRLRQYRNGAGDEDYGAALMAVMDFDELSPESAITKHQEVVRGQAHRRMSEVMFTFRRTVTGGPRNKARMRNVVRELFGETTGDQAAHELAEAWSTAAEYLRKRFNAAGGHIGKRADWGMPQLHDTLAVRKVSFETWRDFILPRLDLDKMVDELTGLRFTPGRLELALRQVYDTIASDGFNTLKPSGVPRGRALANRRADHRFLAFRDADGWTEYQRRFGGGEDHFSVMMAHVDGMARDISRLEVLGPNDAAMLRYLEQVVEKRAVERDVAAGGGDRYQDKAKRQIQRAREMYATITGQVNAGGGTRWARSFAGLRSFLTGSLLGAAQLSAVTDVNFIRRTSRMVGLPVTRALGRQLKLMRPGNVADRKLAVRLGLIADSWSRVAMAQARYVGEIQAPELAARYSDAILKITGLSPWTQAGRWAFGMELLGFMGDQVTKPFADLARPLRNTLERYGIGAGDWDVIRRTELYEHEGAAFLRPDDIAGRADIPERRAQDLANRLAELVLTETEHAVPSASLRGRTALVSDVRPGTFAGELIRSAAMFKNFAVTLMFTQVRRAALQRGGWNKSKAMFDLVLSTTLVGSLALQLKEIAKGRDPRPMDTAEFWAAAFMQGGGVGIFGDFAFSNLNRYDRGLAETVAGPVVGFFNDVRRLTLGNLVQVPGEEPTNFGRELTYFLSRYAPGGSIWYTRLAFQRGLEATIQRWTDPGVNRRHRNTVRRFQREFGQGYWFRPGTTTPQRGPDFGNALGDLQ